MAAVLCLTDAQKEQIRQDKLYSKTFTLGLFYVLVLFIYLMSCDSRVHVVAHYYNTQLLTLVLKL